MAESRYDFDPGEDLPSDAQWHSWLERSLRSEKGLGLLLELRDALHAAPHHVLTRGALWRDGRVCLVGALALHVKGEGYAREMQAEIDAEAADDEAAPAEWTAAVARACGAGGEALSWHLGWLNDERWRHLSPRARWRAALAWVDEQLRRYHPPEESAR